MCVCLHIYARVRAREAEDDFSIDLNWLVAPTAFSFIFALYTARPLRFPPFFSISPMKPEFYLRRLTGNPMETRDGESRRASSENNLDKAETFSERIKFLLGNWSVFGQQLTIRKWYDICLELWRLKYQRKLY